MNNKNKYTTLNMSRHLAEFFCFMKNKQWILVDMIVTGYLREVPEDCRYANPVVPKKQQVRYELQLHDFGKYITLNAQRNIEKIFGAIFDELFFNIVEITHEYTEEKYSELIEKFCKTYELDFFNNFDMLKKKHYRKRLNLVK